jgi:AraC-like DNA-binding protein
MGYVSSNERRFVPYKIAALVEVMRELGHSTQDVLKGSGVEAHTLEDPAALTSIRQYDIACRNALTLTDRFDIPFLVGRKLHLSAYGMYGYALMSSTSLREFFKLGIKYHDLATPTLTIGWSEDCDSAKSYVIDAGMERSSELQEFLITQQFAQQITQIHDVAPNCKPIKACFTFAAPAHARLYAEHLGCPCHFEQPRSEIHYPLAMLCSRLQLSHPLTSKLLQDTCERLLGDMRTSEGISAEVYELLIQTPGVFPSMEAVARALHITSRTLRRRLDAEGTTFMSIADHVRCSLATEYLTSTKLKTDDIASMLGFDEPASFRRAFKRWTGKSPGMLRKEPTG